MSKTIGTVKFFDNSKGYGFIETESGDAMVHHRSILMDGYKTLKQGQLVEFIQTTTERGLQAHEVVPLPPG